MSGQDVAEETTRNRDKSSPADLNGGAEVTPVSKARQAAPQLCAVSAKNLLLITFGCTLGFPTILIPELQKPDSEITVSLEQLTWISSVNLILVPVGCLFSGPISQFLGRRKTMMLANVPFVAAWLLFHYTNNVTMLFMALALTGMTGGLAEAPVLTYVAEITQPHLRGMLSATSSMSIILGVFTQLLAGKLTTWRTVALINIASPILCFTALCLVPESPHWLVEKGRLDEAERSLCWLRGWVTPPHVRTEFRNLVEATRKPAEKDPEASNQRHWTLYTKKTFYAPFFLVSSAFFIGAFGGMATLQTFAVHIFDTLKAPIDKYTATVLLGVAELIGTACCVTLIHFVGKRRLSIFSILGTALCFFCTGLYGYLIKHETIDGENHTWVPTTFLISAAFLSHLGIRLLPWILIGEVFPGKIRSGASGAGGSIGYVFNFTVNKVFLYMVNAMTLAGTFWFYSVISCLGAILLYFILPETEGRTLREIEEHYAGVQNLKRKPKTEELPFEEKWAVTKRAVTVEDAHSKL